MKRNPLVSDAQVEAAVAALAEMAGGGSGTSPVHPPERIRAAETLLGHAWVYDEPKPASETPAETP